MPFEKMFDRLLLAADDMFHILFFVFSLDRKLKSHDFLKDQSQRENIGTDIACFSAQDFRSEITRSPADFRIFGSWSVIIPV